MTTIKTTGTGRASLYSHDIAQLEDFIKRARAYQRSLPREDRRGVGISIDIDDDGYVRVYAAGLEPLKL